jgi:hypothetical protein
MALQIHRRPVRRHPAYAVVWPLGSLAVERSRLIRAARHAPSASLAHQAEDPELEVTQASRCTRSKE